jgi:hypothetical protein
MSLTLFLAFSLVQSSLLGKHVLSNINDVEQDVGTKGNAKGAKLFSVLQMIFSWELYTGVGLGFDEG